jgi:inactivated superfamily I helicase
MLGDYYKKNPKIAALLDEAIEVIKWFNNHSFALGLFNKEQLATYKEIWALILPVITRWTSHFCSLSRILQVNKAMKITVTRNREELMDSVDKKDRALRKAERVMNHVLDDYWWKELTMSVVCEFDNFSSDYY